MDMKELLKAICTIQGEVEGDSVYFAQGAFISPWHVITAAHVIEGMRNETLVFTNSDGVKTEWLKDTSVIVDSEHDLAVVKLAKPIGEECVNFPREIPEIDRNRLDEMRGAFTLVTRRNGYEQLMMVHKTEKWVCTPVGYLLEAMVSSDKILKGHSGSPIVDQNGHIVSVMSSSLRNPSQIATYLPETLPFTVDDPHQIIFGPHQSDVRAIVKKAFRLP